MSRANNYKKYSQAIKLEDGSVNNGKQSKGYSQTDPTAAVG